MSSPLDSCRVAIAGASSLLGKELAQVLEDRSFPASDLVLLDESLAVGTLTEAGGEPTFIRAITEESFERARFAFFAGSAENAARNRSVAQRAGSTVIDLSGPHAEIPAALPWIPGLSKRLPPPVSPQNGSRVGVFRSPAPAVIIACTLAVALQPFAPRRVAIVFFPPVSERDQPGVEELETQTTRLLSFQPISQSVFDAQVAFNLLAGYGEESRPRLEDLRSAIAREAAQYIAGRAAVPAIQLVQVPVFYGYAFVAFTEFDAPCDPGEVQAALVSAGVKLSAHGNAQPTNVSVAGESEIHMGRIERDANVPAGVWLWGVADNLRLAATNAVRIAEELLGF